MFGHDFDNHWNDADQLRNHEEQEEGERHGEATHLWPRVHLSPQNRAHINLRLLVGAVEPLVFYQIGHVVVSHARDLPYDAYELACEIDSAHELYHYLRQLDVPDLELRRYGYSQGKDLEQGPDEDPNDVDAKKLIIHEVADLFRIWFNGDSELFHASLASQLLCFARQAPGDCVSPAEAQRQATSILDCHQLSDLIAIIEAVEDILDTILFYHLLFSLKEVDIPAFVGDVEPWIPSLRITVSFRALFFLVNFHRKVVFANRSALEQARPARLNSIVDDRQSIYCFRVAKDVWGWQNLETIVKADLIGQLYIFPFAHLIALYKFFFPVGHFSFLNYLNVVDRARFPERELAFVPQRHARDEVCVSAIAGPVPLSTIAIQIRSLSF